MLKTYMEELRVILIYYFFTWLSRKFDREHVLDVFKQLATTKGSANDDYKRIIRCLRCYLVGPDFQAWQLLVATTDQLDKEILASPLPTFLHRPSTPARPLTPGRETAASIIAMALTAWSLMTAACGLAANYVQLLAARIGVGVGEASSTPASHSIIADLFPPARRATALAVYNMGASLGLFAGMALGGCADFCVGGGLDASPSPAMVRREDAMVAGEIDPRFRYQGC